MNFNKFSKNMKNESSFVSADFLSEKSTTSEEVICAMMRDMSFKTDKSTMMQMNFKWISEVETVGSFIRKSPVVSFVQDVYGDTLLHKAINCGNFNLSLWLIGHAPNSSYLDLRNHKSLTVLHEAVACQEIGIIRKLILAGANPHIRTFSGNTAFHIACQHGNFACVKALLEPLTHMEKYWRYKKTGSYPRTISQNLEIRDFQGKTCLHLAASNGHLDIVALLLQSGAQVNAPEGLGGRTAIHLAIQNRHHDVVKFLAKERPDCLKSLTWSGYSAYQFALETDPQLAKELIEFGANPKLGKYTDDYTDNELMTDSFLD